MSKLAIYKDNCSLKVGDLGNVSAGEDGRASFRLTDRLIKVIPSMGGRKGSPILVISYVLNTALASMKSRP